MSELLVRVVKIDAIEKHPNADKLEIVKLGGWQIISGKGNYAVGDLAVHVPPDAMVPRTLAEEWEVDKYLAFGKRSPDMGRVRAARLRGVTSYGFLAPNDTFAALDTDLANHYGIGKYEPPPEPEGLQAGQMARNHPLFHTYTDIENLRNFPDKLNYQEPLVVTEKIHGTNSRVGWVRQGESLESIIPGMISFLNTSLPLEKVVGTHRTQRKTEDPGVYGLPFQLHGEALDKALAHVLVMMEHPDVGNGTKVQSVIFFGEIYGPGVQDLTYGKEKAWRVFDIAVNGSYLPWPYVKEICEEFALPLVPHLYPDFYTFSELCDIAQGETALNPGQIKEGIVVRPYVEKTWGNGDRDPNPKRMIFKIISDDYLLRKNGSEHH